MRNGVIYSVLCEFIKVSGSTIGGESVNVELMNGNILTSEDIVE